MRIRNEVMCKGCNFVLGPLSDCRAVEKTEATEWNENISLHPQGTIRTVWWLSFIFKKVHGRSPLMSWHGSRYFHIQETNHFPNHRLTFSSSVLLILVLYL